MNDQIILTQLQSLPEALKKEILGFIGFLLSKYQLGTVQNTPDPSSGPEKKSFGRYRGCLKTGLSIEEIDRQLKQLRDESDWNINKISEPCPI